MTRRERFRYSISLTIWWRFSFILLAHVAMGVTVGTLSTMCRSMLEVPKLYDRSLREFSTDHLEMVGYDSRVGRHKGPLYFVFRGSWEPIQGNKDKEQPFHGMHHFHNRIFITFSHLASYRRRATAPLPSIFSRCPSMSHNPNPSW